MEKLCRLSKAKAAIIREEREKNDDKPKRQRIYVNASQKQAQTAGHTIHLSGPFYKGKSKMRTAGVNFNDVVINGEKCPIITLSSKMSREAVEEKTEADKETKLQVILKPKRRRKCLKKE